MSLYYKVEHLTRFHYNQPVSESVMEVYMRPRTEGNQRCLRYSLHTHPPTRVQSFTDHLRNVVEFFDIPFPHSRLVIRAESLVEVVPSAPLPDALAADAWADLDRLVAEHDYWDMLSPSARVQETDLLRAFAQEFSIERRDDPLSLIRYINTSIHHAFEYVPQSTDVDSPIDAALASRKGVCQDYAHIMIALVRRLGIPCRYVSGYLFYRRDKPDRSTPDQSHAWVEVMLPTLGWIGFDPTNNIEVGERHICVAVGRDYQDVPPSRGIFKGSADSKLEVEVRISKVDQPSEALVTLEDRNRSAAVLESQEEQQQQ